MGVEHKQLACSICRKMNIVFSSQSGLYYTPSGSIEQSFSPSSPLTVQHPQQWKEINEILQGMFKQMDDKEYHLYFHDQYTDLYQVTRLLHTYLTHPEQLQSFQQSYNQSIQNKHKGMDINPHTQATPYSTHHTSAPYSISSSKSVSIIESTLEV